MVHLPELYEKYGDRAQFLFVYVREAGIKMGMTGHHAFPEALREFDEPAGAAPGSRLRLAPRVRAGREHFHLDFPCLIDTEEAKVEELYGAWPKRLLIVDTAGRIAVDSGNLASMTFPWKAITNWLDHNSTPLTPQSAEKHS